MATSCAYFSSGAMNSSSTYSEIDVNVLTTPAGHVGVFPFQFCTKPGAKCLADASVCYCIEETL